MMHSLLVIAVFAVLGRCDGQANYQSAPYSYNKSPGYSSGYDGDAESELDAVVERINTLESRANGQTARINDLRRSINTNQALVRDFPTIYQEHINQENLLINDCLDFIGKKIAQIEKLRAQVNDLQRRTELAEKAIADTVSSDSQTAASAQEQVTISRDNNDQAAQADERTDGVADKLQATNERVTDNKQNIDIYELSIRQAITRLNGFRIGSKYVNLPFENDVARTQFDFPGFAGKVVGFFTGFSFKREQYGYPTGTQYLALYSQISSSSADDSLSEQGTVGYTATDLSANGWTSPSVSAFIAGVSLAQEGIAYSTTNI